MDDSGDIKIDYTNDMMYFNKDNIHAKLLETGLSNRVCYFLIKHYSNEINDLEISNGDLLNEFYKNKINLLQWLPLGLSLNMTYNLYIYLRKQGHNVENIFNLFVSDINKCIEIYKKLKEANLIVDFRLDNVEFNEFIFNSLKLCEKDISKTESFMRMITMIEDKNRNLLRRLQ